MGNQQQNGKLQAYDIPALMANIDAGDCCARGEPSQTVSQVLNLQASVRTKMIQTGGSRGRPAGGGLQIFLSYPRSTISSISRSKSSTHFSFSPRHISIPALSARPPAAIAITSVDASHRYRCFLLHRPIFSPSRGVSESRLGGELAAPATPLLNKDGKPLFRFLASICPTLCRRVMIFLEVFFPSPIRR